MELYQNTLIAKIQAVNENLIIWRNTLLIVDSEQIQNSKGGHNCSIQMYLFFSPRLREETDNDHGNCTDSREDDGEMKKIHFRDNLKPRVLLITTTVGGAPSKV